MGKFGVYVKQNTPLETVKPGFNAVLLLRNRYTQPANKTLVDLLTIRVRFYVELDRCDMFQYIGPNGQPATESTVPL